ncbi:thioesterase family protein [Tepidicaulis sp. LMO-SS28]|uniref:thioesterase family protein n=1 Tax=Tepidicaulis sp. LMO-SS28 TaxID=3447455 RepID=UPI003EDF0C68
MSFEKAPYVTPVRKVEPAWIDYNGHMNMAYYNLIFDNALDALFNDLGIGWEYTKQGKFSCFIGEIHVTYQQELKEGDPVRVEYQLLDWDEKRMHYFGRMYHAEENYLAATSEQISLHVSLETRRTAPFLPEVQEKLKALMAAHAGLPKPEEAGRIIGIRRKTEPA